MARSLFLPTFVVALALAGSDAVANELGSATSRPPVGDPYYARRAQFLQSPAMPHSALPAVSAAAPQDGQPGTFRASLLNPYAEDDGSFDGGVYQGLPGEETTFATDAPEIGAWGDDTCGDDSCGVDTCGDAACAAGACAAGCGRRGRLPLDPCHSGHRVWANFDYLNWKVHGDGIPPLLTTSPLGTSQSDAGVLGEPTTSVLFGNERLNNDQRSGGRFQIGYWIDPEGYTAVEGYYYALETAIQSFAAASTFSTLVDDNQQILARPFHNIFLNVNDALILAFPDFIIGDLEVNLDGTFQAREWSNVQSAGALARQLWKCGGHWNGQLNHRVYLLGGYRFFRLAENLQIQHTIEPVGDVFPAGTLFSSYDEFGTRNLFHGVDFGMINEFRWWRLNIETVLKAALGNMHQELDIYGWSSTFDGTSTTTRAGGLLALPTNMGHFNRDRLTVIPEVEVKIGLQVTPAIRATIGYDFTYVSRVMRPGHQLDLVINTTQRSGPLEGPARPLPVLQSTDVFIQGITAGLEFRY